MIRQKTKRMQQSTIIHAMKMVVPNRLSFILIEPQSKQIFKHSILQSQRHRSHMTQSQHTLSTNNNNRK